MTFSPLDFAHSYLQEGFSVLPLYWFDASLKQCACGNAECHSPGKHPIGQLVPHGLQDATQATETIENWWKMYPQANVGLATGAASGLVVVDIDPRHGGTGTLKELTKKHGDFTQTFTVKTGGGGLHFYFLHPGGSVKNSSGMLGSGVDVRGDGGYVVAPPSNHTSGGTYEIETRTRPAPLPAFIVERTRLVRHTTMAGRKQAENTGGVIPHGMQHAALVSIAGTMRRRGLSGSEILPSLMKVNERCERPGTAEDIRRIAFSMDQYTPDEILSVGDIDLSPDDGMQTLGEIAIEALSRIRAQIAGEILPLNYGFKDLDRETGGSHRGEFTIIAARPGQGKSTIACNMAERFKARTVIFSVEMARHPLVERFLGTHARINSTHIRARCLTTDQLVAMDEAVATMMAIPDEYQIFITDKPRTISAMKRALDATEAAGSGSIDIVFVDYLQLLQVESKRRGSNREQEVAQISRDLARLAIDRDISVIALAQLNRGLEHRQNRRPGLADLRESGQLEQDADLVMFLHRAETYGETTTDINGETYSTKNLAELIISKQRNGPTSTVILQFDGPHYQFRDYARESRFPRFEPIAQDARYGA